MDSKNPLYTRRRRNSDSNSRTTNRDRPRPPRDGRRTLQQNNWKEKNAMAPYDDKSKNWSPNRRSRPMSPSTSSFPYQWQENSSDATMYIDPNMSDYSMIPMNPWPDSTGMGLNPMGFANVSQPGVPLEDPEGGVGKAAGNFGLMPPNQGMFGNMEGNFADYSMGGGFQPNMYSAKEIVYFSDGVLYPPDPDAPLPRIREKPRGCRTLFVGDLPELITRGMIMEIFSKFGDIETLEMNPTNCRIRYTTSESVDAALILSSYQMMISNRDEPAYCSTIYVRYARCERDQHEYDCKQRALERERRHREREAEERNRKPSVVPYSDHNVSTVTENLRNEVKFKTAVGVLIAWLERGECNKKSAGFFFNMLQSTNCVINDLLTKKEELEKEAEEAKRRVNEKLYSISLQLNDIEKVFEAARMQKAWDHFSKIQRKSILLWQMHHVNTKKMISTELVEERVEDKMDLSDDEGASSRNTVKSEEVDKMKQQIVSLQQQLLAAHNKTTAGNKESEEKYLKLWKSFVDVQIDLKKTKSDLDETKKKLMDVLSSDPEVATAAKSQIELSVSSTDALTEKKSLSGREARIISLISTFLNVHPNGASIDYICSYLEESISDISTKEISNVLNEHSSIFSEKIQGVGCNIKKRWVYTGFSEIPDGDKNFNELAS